MKFNSDFMRPLFYGKSQKGFVHTFGSNFFPVNEGCITISPDKGSNEITVLIHIQGTFQKYISR